MYKICRRAALVAALAVSPMVAAPFVSSGFAQQAQESPRPDPAVVASLRPLPALPTPGQMPAGSRMRQIQERGTLVVGVSGQTMLWGYRNPTTGQYEGFDVDLLKRVAAAIFGRWEGHIEFRELTSAQRMDAIINGPEAGGVDILAMTMTINADRKSKVGMSTPYYLAGQSILADRGAGIRSAGDLRGRRVCAAAGSTSLAFLQRIGAVGVSVPEWTRCLVELQTGNVVAVSTDNSILLGLAAMDRSVEIVGGLFTAEPYGIAVNKRHEDLLRFVNGILVQMFNDGSWAQLHGKWMGAYEATPRLPDPVWER